MQPLLLIEEITPAEPGFIALQAESVAQHFNMLRRLEENWERGENRFNAPGEKLLGAFIGGRLVGICGLNRDPFSPHPRAGRIRHLYISEAWRGNHIGQQLLNAVIANSSVCFNFLNTNAPQKAFRFYEQAGFQPVNDENGVTHRLFCAV